MDKEILGCLGIGEQNTDYVLCNGNSDLLPPLVKKDEIRYEYNQYANKWSYVSCTIFAAVGMLSDLANYKFSYDEIKEIDELSYTRGRIRGQGWYVQSAVKLVADWWNEKMDRKIAYYRLSKFDDEIIEDVINNLYTIDGNFCPTKEYNEDKQDGMIDGINFGNNTNGHSVDVICKEGQRSVKDSGSRNNIYGLKNNLSKISNYGPYFYVYTFVKDDNLERVKDLNKFKSYLLQTIENNSAMRHLTYDVNYQEELHKMNEMNRAKLKEIDEQLKLLS